MSESLGDRLSSAAKAGDLPTLRQLLPAAPAGLLTRCDRGRDTPLFLAILHKQEEAARLLLETAPAAALVKPLDGALPLLTAAAKRLERTTRLLLKAAPSAAAAPGPLRSFPLRFLAAWGDASLVRQMLAAAPAAAATPDAHGTFPLHAAAAGGNPAAVKVLLGAAPAIAEARTGAFGVFPSGGGPLPLELALDSAQHHSSLGAEDRAASCIEAARLLLPASPLQAALAALALAGSGALPLFADLAACRPLSAAQWQRVPPACPALGSALPAVLQRSEAEAGLLVHRMKETERCRLRTAALCLARAGRRAGAALPAAVAGSILAQAATPA